MNEEEIIKKYMSNLGKKSSEALTSKQRKERASKAVKARWDKKRKEDVYNSLYIFF